MNPRSPFRLALAASVSLAVLTGCAAVVPTVVKAAVKSSSSVSVMPVSHDSKPAGGDVAAAAGTSSEPGSVPALSAAVAVTPAALGAIADTTKQAAAATLGTELGAQLRAESTMRDADLMVSANLIGQDASSLISQDSSSLISQDSSSLISQDSSSLVKQYVAFDDGESGGESGSYNGGYSDGHDVTYNGGYNTGYPQGTPSPTRSSAPTPRPSASWVWGSTATPKPAPSGSGLPAGSFGEHEEASGDAKTGGTESPEPRRSEAPEASSPEPVWRDHAKDDADRTKKEHSDEDNARQAWQKLPPDQVKTAQVKAKGHDDRLKATLGTKLTAKAKAFAKQGEDKTSTTADGSKTVVTTLDATKNGEMRTVTITRKYDASGTLVQVVVALSGLADGVELDCIRTRTVLPDGSIRITIDNRFSFNGAEHDIHVDKTVDPNGNVSGAGTLTHPDGSTSTLAVSGTDGGTETLTAKDASGVSATVQAAPGAANATATLDAGAAGSTSIKLSADDDTGS